MFLAFGQLQQKVEKARTSKNFALSDKVRDDLKKLDVQLMDGKDGTTFSID